MLQDVRVMAAKIEGTIGTAESLSGTDGVFNAYNVEIQPTIDMFARQRQGGFSPQQSVPGLRSGRCTFSIDLIGGSGDPAWASVLLPGMGWVASTGTYSPKSLSPGSSVKTITLGVYEDGKLKMLKGAVGTAVLNFVTGIPVKADFTFIGVWVAPTDVANVTPTYETIIPPRFAGATLTFGSYTPKISTLTLDLGNSMYLRQDATQAAGFHSGVITGRKVIGSLDPESALVATKDLEGEWLAMTEAALSMVIGPSGNEITIAAPKVQWTNVQESNRQRLQTENLSFQCNGSSSAGNDELTFAFN